MLMVWRMRQDIELQKTRSIVQSVLAASIETEEASKQLRESWQDLLDEMYPYQKGQRKSADQAAIDYLKSETKRGPYKIRPLQPVGRTRSKLKTRYLQRTEDAGEVVSKMRLGKDRHRRRTRPV